MFQCLPKTNPAFYETTLLSPKFAFALHRRHLDGLRCLMCLRLGGIYRFVFCVGVGYSTLYLKESEGHLQSCDMHIHFR